MYEIKWLQFCQSTILTEEVKYINPSALYSDSLKPLSVLRTGLKLGWQPIFSKKVYKSFLMQLFSAVAKIFLLIFLFFSPQKVKKNTLRSCTETLKSTFFPLLPELLKRPKQKDLCSKMWPINQLYIELELEFYLFKFPVILDSKIIIFIRALNVV